MAAGGEATRDSPSGSRVSEVRAKGRAAGGDWCDQIREVGERESSQWHCAHLRRRELREGWKRVA